MRRVAALAPLALAPKLALACSVCNDPNDAAAGAFFDMTIFMSLTPLLTMGLIGWFVWFKIRAAAAAAAADTQP